MLLGGQTGVGLGSVLAVNGVQGLFQWLSLASLEPGTLAGGPPRTKAQKEGTARCCVWPSNPILQSYQVYSDVKSTHTIQDP